jgi:dihydropyrimidinase
MNLDGLVRGGEVVLPELDRPIRADVAIRGGRVAALLEPDHGLGADREWDAEGRLVLPGAIDPHVHVSWPYLGARTADDYATATLAAGLGGTTSIIDFAIEGRESPLAAVEARRRQAEGQARIDFSLHCVVSSSDPSILREMAAVVDAGVTSFKLYMTYRRRGLAVDEATIRTVFERAAQLGAVVGVHAEDADIDDEGTARMQAAGKGLPRYLPDAKPPHAEAKAIATAARIAAAAGAKLWILHLSSREGLEAALEARATGGQPAALETCPQYLMLDRKRLEGADGQRFLCSPPLRDAESSEALWAAAGDGRVDWIGTDHCLFLAAQKDAHADAFWDCPHGVPGIETRPGLVLGQGTSRGLGVNRLAELLSAGAARWFGLYPRKGTLLPGSDADLAIWDPRERIRLANDQLHMGGDWTPYEGMGTWAPPPTVLVRGEPIVESDGTPIAPGHGRFLARPLGQPTAAAVR